MSEENPVVPTEESEVTVEESVPAIEDVAEPPPEESKEAEGKELDLSSVKEELDAVANEFNLLLRKSPLQRKKNQPQKNRQHQKGKQRRRINQKNDKDRRG